MLSCLRAPNLPGSRPLFPPPNYAITTQLDSTLLDGTRAYCNKLDPTLNTFSSRLNSTTLRTVLNFTKLYYTITTPLDLTHLDFTQPYSIKLDGSEARSLPEQVLIKFNGASSKTQLMERDVQNSETVNYCIVLERGHMCLAPAEIEGDP